MRYWVLPAIIAITGCSGTLTPNVIDHGLPPNPSYKATQQCVNAVGDIQQETGLGRFRLSGIFLPGGQCAVSITLDNNNGALDYLNKIKAQTNYYTYQIEDTTLVPIWLDEKDQDQTLNYVPPTPADCNSAASLLSDDGLQASLAVVENTDIGAIHDKCYIQLVFHDDANFQKFFSWKNPHSKNGELLHIHLPKDKGALAEVRIQVISQNSKN